MAGLLAEAPEGRLLQLPASADLLLGGGTKEASSELQEVAPLGASHLGQESCPPDP